MFRTVGKYFFFVKYQVDSNLARKEESSRVLNPVRALLVFL